MPNVFVIYWSSFLGHHITHCRESFFIYLITIICMHWEIEHVFWDLHTPAVVLRFCEFLFHAGGIVSTRVSLYRDVHNGGFVLLLRLPTNGYGCRQMWFNWQYIHFHSDFIGSFYCCSNRFYWIKEHHLEDMYMFIYFNGMWKIWSLYFSVWGKETFHISLQHVVFK